MASSAAQTKMDAFFQNAPLNISRYADQQDQERILANMGFNPEYQNGLVGAPAFFKKLGGYDVDMERQALITQKNQEYERASIDSARAWSEYMDNTQYQRRVKDLEAAGLNPWLAVQNGISGSGAPSVDTGGTAQQAQGSTGQSSGILRGLLMLLVGIASKSPAVASAGGYALASKSWYK